MDYFLPPIPSMQSRAGYILFISGNPLQASGR